MQCQNIYIFFKVFASVGSTFNVPSPSFWSSDLFSNQKQPSMVHQPLRLIPFSRTYFLCNMFYTNSLLQMTVFSTDAMWIPLSGCNGKMDYLWVKSSEIAHGCIKKRELTFNRQFVLLCCAKDSRELDFYLNCIDNCIDHTLYVVKLELSWCWSVDCREFSLNGDKKIGVLVIHVKIVVKLSNFLQMCENSSTAVYCGVSSCARNCVFSVKELISKLFVHLKRECLWFHCSLTVFVHLVYGTCWRELLKLDLFCAMES